VIDSAPFWQWVNERHAIYIRKELRRGVDAGDVHAPLGADLEEADPDHYAMRETGPLTSDPVLAQFSFCNVFRELDRVTMWIDRHIREPFKDHPDLWFMLATARYINWPETLAWLINTKVFPGQKNNDLPSWPSRVGFEPAWMGDALDVWSALGKKVYTGSYMIRAESNPKAEWYSWTKQQYIARIVLGRLWEDRGGWRAMNDNTGHTLEQVWGWFQDKRYIGWGPFMAYQVVVDMRHTRLLRNATDINTWAALGPGSRRGLNRLHGRDVDFSLSQAQGLEEMRALFDEQGEKRAPWVPPIDLSDIQNCLCETDKWLRARTGEGRPRSLYVPGRQTF